MTELAYLADMTRAYERTFTARVVALPPGAVVLDRTLFYPAGGGQPCDRGTVAADPGVPVPIVDVVKSGGTVLHRFGRHAGPAAAGLRIGAPVTGAIDWERRHLHMRLHTAQHLVSARLFELAGRRTRRASLAGRAAVIDLEAPWPESEPWERLVAAVRDVLAHPRPVRVEQVPRADWLKAPGGRSGLVPLPPAVDPVRVIAIEGVDRCPCGGTHVRSTGEIGPLDLPPPAGARVTLTLDAAAPSNGPG